MGETKFKKPCLALLTRHNNEMGISIVSNDVPKCNDWVVNIYKGKPRKTYSFLIEDNKVKSFRERESVVRISKDFIKMHSYQKIIASTHSTLWFEDSRNDLPRISNAFKKRYVYRYNKGVPIRNLFILCTKDGDPILSRKGNIIIKKCGVFHAEVSKDSLLDYFNGEPLNILL